MRSVRELAEALGMTTQGVRKMARSKVKLKMEKLSDRRTASFVISDREFERVVAIYAAKQGTQVNLGE